MSSTNSTSNYGLSQFVGSDKPAWLADYNQDMNKIDIQMKLNADSATSAAGSASTANTAVGTLANLTTTAKTDLVSAVNEVNSTATTAQNTANSAATTATQGKTTADGLATYLTLNTTVTPTISVSTGTLGADAYINVQKNASNSLAKIYGQAYVGNLNGTSGTFTLTISDTGLRPSEAITFNGCALVRIEDSTYHIFRDIAQSYTLNTDGTITATITLNNVYSLNFLFTACLLFITDFGDVPTPGE